MKKTLLIIALMGISTYSYTNSGGSPAGKSGSPASNGQTCSGGYCHGGGSPNGNEAINLKVDITPFAGSSNYSNIINDSIDTEITLTASAASSSRIGFSASIEDANGNHIGELSTGSGNTKLSGSDYVTHKSSSTNVTGDSITWVWYWDTQDIEDSVIIYVAVNYTNSNGQASGDYVVTQTKTLYEGQVFNTEENKINGLLVSPNPASSTLKVKAEGLVAIRLYNTLGRFIQLDYSASLEDQAILDVSALARGNYILHAEYSDGSIQYKHVVLQ